MTHTVKFEGLSQKLNVCVLTMAAKLFPCGFDVGPDAPSSLQAIKDHVEKTGRMKVSDEFGDTSIYGDKEVNCAFRAWHDFHHLRGNHEFTPEGEYQVAVAQCKDISKVYGYTAQAREFMSYIKADVVGQVEYFERYGEFPQDQKAFVLAWMKDTKAAYSRKF